MHFSKQHTAAYQLNYTQKEKTCVILFLKLSGGIVSWMYSLCDLSESQILMYFLKDARGNSNAKEKSRFAKRWNRQEKSGKCPLYLTSKRDTRLLKNPEKMESTCTSRRASNRLDASSSSCGLGPAASRCVGAWGHAASRAPSQPHGVWICALTRPPSDSYAHERLRANNRLLTWAFSPWLV